MLRLLTGHFKTYVVKSSTRLKFTNIIIMGKSRPHVTLLKEKRIKNREKTLNTLNYGVSNCYLQVLGTGARGAPKCLYLFTDNTKYLFNVGEGTQRLAQEHKIKIAKLEHVFITYPIWENIGGLPGLSLTLQDSGVPDLTLHGPQGIESLFKATEKFIVLCDLRIKAFTSNCESFYEDNAIIINCVPLKSSEKIYPKNETNSFSSYGNQLQDDTDYYTYLKKDKQENKTSSSLASVNQSDNEENFLFQTSIAYICRLTRKLGKLNLEKCVERNVSPGPLLGKLKAGEDVTLEDGTIVKAEDVKDPDLPGPIFIVLECPKLEFLDSLLNQSAFRKYQVDNIDAVHIPQYIIHFTPQEIVEDARYQKWINQFPKETQHVYINERNTCLGSIGMHDIQYKLNMLDEKIFPSLNDEYIPKITLNGPEEEPDDIFARVQKRLMNGNTDEHINVRELLKIPDTLTNTLKVLPLRGSGTIVSDCIYTDPEYIKNETRLLEGFDEELKMLKFMLKSVSENEENIHRDKQYPIVTFLGTGSCIPNKMRNTSGILISMSHDNYILMDCGEGTFSQFVHHFGIDRTEQILSNINIIFISHLHADHHLGLINILLNRKKAVKKLGSKAGKVYLLAPRTIIPWLRNYQYQFEEILDETEFISNQELVYSNVSLSALHKLMSLAPLKQLVTSFVIHCPHSFGISLTHSNGFKITYSGDCRPSKDLAIIGEYSDLLIHEATFEDDLIHEAKQKLHSTTSEAISVARDMKAKYVILTHFSQRYSKVPLINDTLDENTGIAFDNMVVSMSDLPKLHLFYPIFKILFDDAQQEMINKRIKRKKLLD